jgi:hypothetical protein
MIAAQPTGGRGSNDGTLKVWSVTDFRGYIGLIA